MLVYLRQFFVFFLLLLRRRLWFLWGERDSSSPFSPKPSSPAACKRAHRRSSYVPPTAHSAAASALATAHTVHGTPDAARSELSAQ
jgi:hypothetical protein